MLPGTEHPCYPLLNTLTALVDGAAGTMTAVTTAGPTTATTIAAVIATKRRKDRSTQRPAHEAYGLFTADDCKRSVERGGAVE